MPAPAVLAERARGLVDGYKAVLEEAGQALKTAEGPEAGWQGWRQNEAKKSLNFIDSLAGNTYKLSQDLQTIPQGLGFMRQGILDSAAPVYDLAFAKLEGNLAALRKKPVNNMGALPPEEQSFYPTGESFDWYNPADWMRGAEYNAAMAAYQTGEAASTAVTQVLGMVFKTGLAFVALKYIYEKTKQPTRKGKP